MPVKVNSFRWLVLILVFSFTVAVFGQDRSKKSLMAVKVERSPVIDGVLNDSVWRQLPLATNFIQHDPYNGHNAHDSTIVRIAYNDEALYIGAVMFARPEELSKGLSSRDDWGAADYFGIWLSPFNDGINGYEFWISAAGVQLDSKRTLHMSDRDWDEVWFSEVAYSDSTWSVEIKIPYAALRFPKSDVQTWGLNFWRTNRKTGESSTWNFIDKEISGSLSQSGQLTEIKDIKPPLRLTFLPYMSGYVQKITDRSIGTSIKGGMDVKYGINESFTLDMMLIPDFGQVESDDEVLNLSPFETKYAEKRAFFTEGSELFNKGGIFYSKRIGGTPNYRGKVEDWLKTSNDTVYEVVKENPINTQLINATKLSGRTDKGLGIGVLNAMESASYATVTDTFTGQTRRILTQPFTNSNIFVLDQTLRNDSYISMINSNYMNDSIFADVVSVLSDIQDKRSRYSIYGRINYSYRNIKEYSDPHQEEGFRYDLNVSKIYGKYRFTVARSVESDHYNINDLGYISRNNEVISRANFIYRDYTPVWKIQMRHYTIGTTLREQYKPRQFSEWTFHVNTYTRFANYSDIRINAYVKPFLENNFYEPRIDGRIYVEPLSASYFCSLGSDSRKKYNLNMNGSFWHAFDNQQRSFSLGTWDSYNISDNSSVYVSFGYSQAFNSNRYVKRTGDNLNDSIFFGVRDQVTIESVLGTSYNFNKDVSLNLRMRHYWSEVKHEDQFYLLKQDGYLTEDDYSGEHDVNFNTFNIDMTFSWRFAPGSEMVLMWKNSISARYSDADVIFYDNYFSNFINTLSEDQFNSLSIKILYYLDYSKLKGLVTKS